MSLWREPDSEPVPSQVHLAKMPAKKGNVPKTPREYGHDLVERTAITGVKEIAESRAPLLGRFVWIIVLLCAAVITAAQVSASERISRAFPRIVLNWVLSLASFTLKIVFK